MHKKFLIRIITMVATVAIVAILAAFGIISFSVVPNVSTFYIAIGFYIPFAIWFGGWGCVANSIGCTIGAILSGVPLPIAIVANTIPHIFQSGLPAWALRGLKMDPILKTGRDWIIYLLVCVVGAVVTGGILFMSIMFAFGIMPWGEAFTAGILSYVIGDIIVVLLISTPLLFNLSRGIKRSRFYVQGWWN